MKLTRRRKTVLALVAVVAVGGYVALFVPFGRSIRDARQITTGMTIDEACHILGEYKHKIHDVIWWRMPDGLACVVIFNDKVESVGIVDNSKFIRLLDQLGSVVGMKFSNPHVTWIVEPTSQSR